MHRAVASSKMRRDDERPESHRLQNALALCGLLSSLLYVAIDVVASLRFPDYHRFRSQAISELSANGAPTQFFVTPLFVLYDLLLLAFGLGVWMSSRQARTRVMACALFAVGAVGLLGPFFQMNVRGSGSISEDAGHIVLTAVLVAFILIAVGVGGWTRAPWFRAYSRGTFSLVLLFGAATTYASRGLSTGEGTPWLGIVERIDIGLYLLWVAVFSIVLHRSARRNAPSITRPHQALPAS